MCTFIGAQAQIDTKATGGKNPLIELAASIDVTGGGRDREMDELRGPKVADRIEDDPRFGATAADPEHGVEADNSTGSYEAFMTAFGGPPPMPGRGG